MPTYIMIVMLNMIIQTIFEIKKRKFTICSNIVANKVYIDLDILSIFALL